MASHRRSPPRAYRWGRYPIRCCWRAQNGRAQEAVHLASLIIGAFACSIRLSIGVLTPYNHGAQGSPWPFISKPPHPGSFSPPTRRLWTMAMLQLGLMTATETLLTPQSNGQEKHGFVRK